MVADWQCQCLIILDIFVILSVSNDAYTKQILMIILIFNMEEFWYAV